MDTQIHTMLLEYGLDDREITIYLALVGNGQLTAYRVAKECRLNRSTTYDVLERLITKGFVSKSLIEKTAYYAANSLERIRSSLKDRDTILLNLIPRIEKLESGMQPHVTTYEGVSGQKEFTYHIFEAIRHEKITFVYMLSNTYSYSETSNLYLERLIHEFVALKKKPKKIDAKVIWDESYRGDAELKKYDLVSENRFFANIPSRSSIIVYDGHIAFMYSTDQAYVIDITNTVICEEFKYYFLKLWMQAKP